MTSPAPWKCPSCEAWLAPHVTEHRCQPPESGVTALPYIGDPPGSTSTCVSTATLPGTVTYNLSGSVISEQELVRTIQKSLLRNASRNWRSGPQFPGRAA